MSLSSNAVWVHHGNSIRWRVQTTKLLITQLCSSSPRLSVVWKSPDRHFIFKHSQSILFSYVQTLCSTSARSDVWLSELSSRKNWAAELLEFNFIVLCKTKWDMTMHIWIPALIRYSLVCIPRFWNYFQYSTIKHLLFSQMIITYQIFQSLFIRLLKH